VAEAVADRLIAPADLGALAAAVRDAAHGGAAVAVTGSGGWWTDVPDDVRRISTSRLDTISAFNPADLVVTAGAGAPLDRLAERLAARGVWLALDPPGPLSRTVGGVLAGGAGGPLAARYGAARDHVLGLVVVAGDGTVVRLGGRVVKNVAGFDLAKLVVGGHGAYGIIAEAHLRLRALPRADRTAIWRGTAAWVARTAATALGAGAAPAALEAVSPELSAALGWGSGADGRWTLAARALGSPAGVDEELALIARAAGARSEPQSAGGTPWNAWRVAVGRWPVVLRIGADPGAWADAVALAARHLDLIGASATVPRGTVRVGAARCDADAARALRAEAAARGWPVTLERADAATRRAVGVWGALPPSISTLAQALRSTFDPGACLATPLGA
jgi:glycolate dehydrogenase FAD-binding subunit